MSVAPDPGHDPDPDPGRGHDPGHDPLLDLVDDARHDEVVRRRNLRRGLSDRASRSATWVGALRDLSELRAEVAVQLAGGRVHRGRLTAVAADHLVVTGNVRSTVVIASSAVRSLRPRADLPGSPSHGDRLPPDERTLAETLEELLEHGADVVVGLRDVGDPIRGRAEALGEDLLTLTTPAGATILVPVEAIADVTWGGR